MSKNLSLIMFFVLVNLFFELSCITTKNNLKSEKIDKTPEKSFALGQLFNKNNTIEDHFSFGILKNCNEINCNYIHGICTNSTTCVCKKQYANFVIKDTNTSDYSACSYSRKHQQIAFLLEFFIPFGAAHFYLGNYEAGLLKLLALIVLPVLLICLGVFVRRPNNTSMITKKRDVDSLIILYAMGVLMWVFYDVLNIALDRYKDSNGVSMLAW